MALEFGNGISLGLSVASYLHGAVGADFQNALALGLDILQGDVEVAGVVGPEVVQVVLAQRRQRLEENLVAELK